jgi:hypothetical protein
MPKSETYKLNEMLQRKAMKKFSSVGPMDPKKAKMDAEDKAEHKTKVHAAAE